jgi:hypothetical protein
MEKDMPSPETRPQEQKRLESWKEIGQFLGVAARTVQLWEETRGLPVRRRPGLRGRVSVSVAELERWRAANERALAVDAQAADPSRRWIFLGVIIAALTLAGLGGNAWIRPTGEPVRLEVSGPVLTVFNAEGREVWRYTFPFQIVNEQAANRTRAAPVFVDLEGDGGNELLFPALRDSTSFSDVLYCFSKRGAVRWTYRPGRRVRTREEIFRDVFELRWLATVPRPDGAGRWVVAGNGQTPGYPFEVAVLDANGRVSNRYWHSGHLTANFYGDLEKDGRQKLYLGGVSNAEKRAGIVVLDAARLGGASKERNPDYQLLDLGPPVEVARILLPVSLLSRHLRPYPIPLRTFGDAGGWTLDVDEGTESSLGHTASLFYSFGPRLDVQRVAPGDTTEVIYRKLIAAGSLPADARKQDRARDFDIEVLTPWQEAETPRR